MTTPITPKSESSLFHTHEISEKVKVVAGLAAISLAWAYFEPSSLVGRATTLVVPYFSTHFFLCGVDVYRAYQHQNTQLANIVSKAKFGKLISLNHANFNPSIMEREILRGIFIEILKKWIKPNDPTIIEQFPEINEIADELTNNWIKNNRKGACYGLSVSISSSLMNSSQSVIEVLTEFTKNQPGHILFQMLQQIHSTDNSIEVYEIIPKRILGQITNMCCEKDPISKLMGSSEIEMLLKLNRAIESLKSISFEESFLRMYGSNITRIIESTTCSVDKEGFLNISEKYEGKHCILGLKEKNFNHAVYCYANSEKNIYIILDSNIGFLICENKEQLAELAPEFLNTFYSHFNDLKIVQIQSIF